ncbi:MAG: cupin domain-containing protein [Actinomycetota bacterium]|nr:cupin domain-containing protein [Actinomycetota bacterium]
MTIKAGAESTGGGFCLIETRAPVGHGPPLHVHHNEHEAFYILEGALEIICDGQPYHANAGGFAFLPCGVAHTLRVVGESPVRMLTITVPGGAEAFFRAAGRPADGPGLPPPAGIDIAMLSQVAPRHGIEIVGPPIGATATASGLNNE